MFWAGLALNILLAFWIGQTVVRVTTAIGRSRHQVLASPLKENIARTRVCFGFDFGFLQIESGCRLWLSAGCHAGRSGLAQSDCVLHRIERCHFRRFFIFF